MRPLAIDLFCGLGGWTRGLALEGWDCIGFDIEQHVYGEDRYPAQLVIQDVLTLHGRQFRDVGQARIAMIPLPLARHIGRVFAC
jgi:site-specific DNA-cytosine methylase